MHDSHWDADTLELLTNKYSESFFLMDVNSTIDQPNDNGLNTALKACFSEVKDELDKMYGTTEFTPPQFNSVIVEAWTQFTHKSTPIGGHAVERTSLFPLQSPMKCDNQSSAGACTTAIQCSKGTTSMKSEQMVRTAIDVFLFTVTHAAHPMTILGAKENCYRNLLV